MQNWTFISILAAIVFMAQSYYGLNLSQPNWPGSYYTTSKCDLNQCCCMYGLVTMSSVGSKKIRLVSQMEGSGCPVNRYVDSTISLPSSFKTSLSLLDTDLDVILSSDSRIIDVVNPDYPECSGGAVRA